jgi:hypothetical protein
MSILSHEIIDAQRHRTLSLWLHTLQLLVVHAQVGYNRRNGRSHHHLSVSMTMKNTTFMSHLEAEVSVGIEVFTNHCWNSFCCLTQILTRPQQKSPIRRQGFLKSSEQKTLAYQTTN